MRNADKVGVDNGVGGGDVAADGVDVDVIRCP